MKKVSLGRIIISQEFKEQIIKWEFLKKKFRSYSVSLTSKK